MIWEETKSINKDNQKISNWLSRTKLFESKESIEDIKFGPRHLGLILAAASSEGLVRIYEAPDIMNLS